MNFLASNLHSDFSLKMFLVAGMVISLAAFAMVFVLYNWLKKQPQENAKISKVGALINKGANTFLRKEYIVLAKFAGVASVIIFLLLPSPIWQVADAANKVAFILDHVYMVLAYVFGTVFSAIAGKIGIAIATRANMKTAEAAVKGIKPSFLCGFRGGAVMGLAVVGASLLGVSALFLILGDATFLLGFSFGASSLALFAKAGGGIFTKTADIAADLVGKVELGIPEDDPRNPAVIADNVGDNVGDVAGMGADLFDSHVASSAAALVMATSLDSANNKINAIMVFCFTAIGLLSSLIGIAMARMGKKNENNPTVALNLSTYITTGIYLVLTALATWIFKFQWRIWGAASLGLAVGVIIGIATDYFTDDKKKPVQNTAKSSESGPAFTILSGVSYGFISILPAMIGIAVAALGAYYICLPLGSTYAMFGISMSAVGMLSIVAMIISNDAYGPIVDNARGLAEMGELGDEVVERTDVLDSAGNTVKAVTKGFAIAAAGLTVIALLFAFMTEINTFIDEHNLDAALKLVGFDIINPLVFFGLLIGAAVPAVFSALQILGVDKNAQRMVAEIHKQFKENPGIIDGSIEPDYDSCIAIATKGAIRELIPAGLFAIATTVLVGLVGGVSSIGGFLAGNIVSGLLLALFMSNSGGLWDNSKKYIESGHHGGKGSVAHKAAVVGDTVGDPFKDTSGPSINTQITVVSLVATLIGSLFINFNLVSLFS